MEEPPTKRARMDICGSKEEEEGGGSCISSSQRRLPTLPQRFLEAKPTTPKFESDMVQLLGVLEQENSFRESLRGPTRDLKALSDQCLRNLREGTPIVEVKEQCQRCLKELMDSLKTFPEQYRNFGYTAESIQTYLSMLLLKGFYDTGSLLTKSALAKEVHELTSTEYLLGVLRFAEELETYGMGRAMWQDASSVLLSCNLAQSIQVEFMEFNLRNGLLRRKFDGLKYKVRKLENILYELSLIGVEAEREKKEEEESFVVDKAEWAAMKQELDEHTEAREFVIKESRNPQKESKKAIFALHRGEISQAGKTLAAVKEMACEIAKKTTLSRDEIHSGSFGAALEEFAEARCFHEWLANDGNLLPFSVLKEEVDITESGYIGGLVDFTGELGRFAVAEATARRIDSVKRVVTTCLEVQNYALRIQALVGGKQSKKVEAAFTNAKKVENVLYELTLVMRSNRKTLELDSMKEQRDITSDNTEN